MQIRPFGGTARAASRIDHEWTSDRADRPHRTIHSANGRAAAANVKVALHEGRKMRLKREDTSGGAVWWSEDQDVQMLGVWTEKRTGLGEDAEPTMLHHFPSGRGMIGVYDGLGGSGARHAGTTEDGRTLSNAFVASRLAFLTVQDWFTTSAPQPESLEDRLRGVFDGARQSGAGPKLRGTLTRELPTTAAVIEYDAGAKRRSMRVHARWAGDSRCYLLRPATGLQQLSRDDSAIDDALQTLVADQPMTNLLCAGQPFTLHSSVHEDIGARSILLCATDGFFNYVKTPALFEHALLDKLTKARDLAHWGSLLADWVQSVAADDATLALFAYGFRNFGDMQRRFRDRLIFLWDDHALPMEVSDLGDHAQSEEEQRAALTRRRSASWDRYRPSYSALIPDRSPASAAGERP
jgi:serine/threonine protein phosphatase PrpC